MSLVGLEVCERIASAFHAKDANTNHDAIETY